MCKFKLGFFLSLLYLLNYLELEKRVGASASAVGLDWMQTGKLGIARGGEWLQASTCPDGSFVNGYQLQYGQRNVRGEITGLQLNCSRLVQNYKLNSVGFLNANGATIQISSNNSISVFANRQAVGFFMARWTDSNGFEYVGGRKLTFVGESESRKYKRKNKFKFPEGANSTLWVNVGCREDWAVCGVQGRELMTTPSALEDGEPVSILTQLRFKCCYYCIPRERRVLLDDYTNSGSTDYSRTIRRTVGSQVEKRKSSSGSRSTSKDTTNETQKGNSITGSSSISTSEGATNSISEGQNESNGWNTGEELRISSSSQNSKDTRTSNSILKTKTESLSVGKSSAQIESTHWSETKGTSSSQTRESSHDVGVHASATFGFMGSGVTVGGSYNYKNSQSSTTGQHEDKTKGGGSQTEQRNTQDQTNTNQETSSTDHSSGASETISTGEDKSQISGTNAAIASSKERSRQDSINKATEQSIQRGAQAMFTYRQAQQDSWQLSWDLIDSGMWREEREDTYAFTCEPMHRCRIEQVYGTCGALQIHTPKIVKRIDLLKYGQFGGSPEPEIKPEPDANKTKEIQWEINIPGQKWVVAKNVSHWEPSGHWTEVQFCQPDAVVTGHAFKYLPQAGITGIALLCSTKYGPDEGDKEHDNDNMLLIHSKDEPGRNRTRERWSPMTRGSRAKFAEKFSFVKVEKNGRSWMGNHEIIYRSIEPMKIPGKMAANSIRSDTECPEEHAICGVTAMMDKAGIGIFTAMGFKCCHHCIPEEKWVTFHHFDNNSPSDEEKEVRITVGIRRTESASNSTNRNDGKTVDEAGISRSGLHAGFSAKFGKSNSTGFDWRHTTDSVWEEEKTVTEKYKCASNYSCVYRELMGSCGRSRVTVGKFCKVSVPIGTPVPESCITPTDPQTHPADENPDPNSGEILLPGYLRRVEHEETPVQVLNDGEIWIEARNIQTGTTEDEETIWGKIESCPLGTFVTGYRLKKLGGDDEDTQDLLTGLELECSSWDSQGRFKQVKIIQSEQSASQSELSASDTNPNQHKDMIQSKNVSTPAPAVGFNFFSYKWFEDDGEQVGQSTTKHSLIFDRWSRPVQPVFENPDYEVKLFPVKFLCPTDYVICGMRTSKDSDTGVLTDVKFQCCYHCDPSETEDELDNWENQTNDTMTHIIPHVSVGAVVEVKNPLAPIEGSTPETFKLIKGFSDYQHLKEMFSHRLPKKSGEIGRSKIEWKKQAKSVWTEENKISVDNNCKPQSSCVVNRLVGVCGKFQIPTSFTQTKYILNTDKISEEKK